MALRATRSVMTPIDSGSCLIRSQTGRWDGVARPVADLADPLDDQEAATTRYVDQVTGKSQVTGVWECWQDTAMADPGTGRMRFNTTPASAVTQIAVSRLSNNGTDFVSAFQQLAANDDLAMQDQGNALIRGEFNLTAGGAVDNGTWFLFNVTFVSGAGVLIGNKNLLLVRFTHYDTAPVMLPALESRLAALEARITQLEGG